MVLEINAKTDESKSLEEIASKMLLTCSATDYTKNKEIVLEDYDLRKVSITYVDLKMSLQDVVSETESRLVKKAEELGAEVITDLRMSLTNQQCNGIIAYLIGTALIPKKRTK